MAPLKYTDAFSVFLSFFINGVVFYVFCDFSFAFNITFIHVCIIFICTLLIYVAVVVPVIDSFSIPYQFCLGNYLSTLLLMNIKVISSFFSITKNGAMLVLIAISEYTSASFF